MLNSTQRKLLVQLYRGSITRRGVFNTNKVDNTSGELRPYRHDTFFELINRYIVYSMTQYDFTVKNLENLYNISSKVLGHSLTDYLVEQTAGRIFTAGKNLEELEQYVKKQYERGNPVMLDYACEALDGLESNDFFNENCEMYCKVIELASRYKDTDTAIKLSALGSKKIIRKYNTEQSKLVGLSESSLTKGIRNSTVSEYKQKIQKDLGVSFNEQEFNDFMKNVLNIVVENDQQLIDNVYVRAKLHVWYIDNDPIKNNNVLLRRMTKDLTEQDIKEIQELNQRQDRIYQEVIKHNQKVLIDAEQTYLQVAMDTIAEQFQFKYNKEKPYLRNTIQNYLKYSDFRVQYEIDKIHLFNYPLAIKLVRGAYIVEERKIAKEQGIPDPIHETYDATSNSMNSHIQQLIQQVINNTNGNLVVGTHNQQTAEVILDNLNKHKQAVDSVSVAQLMGLADNLTELLRSRGYKIYKFVPFGKTRILIPYYCRRAQEQRQTMASVKSQIKLIQKEAFRRITFKN